MGSVEQRRDHIFGDGRDSLTGCFLLLLTIVELCNDHDGRTGCFFLLFIDIIFVQVGLALVSFVALGLGMPIGNAVGNCVHKRTLKSGIALLLVVLGSYSLVYFVVNSQ